MAEKNGEETEEVINPYKNREIIRHKKFISHLGFSFIDLRYVEKKFFNSKRTILRNICGQINYGTLNGIFGPKYSGKSALLKCLSGRISHGIDLNTQIFANPDTPFRLIYLENKTANNILLSLTVAETLEYSFKFRNTATSEQRQTIVKELMKNLDLINIANNNLINCSNEEQLRTQIAMCLSTIDKPNMIFMEEPFNELDNVGIKNFVNLMKKLSRLYSIAVTFSTSQILDSDVLSIFDKLYVLSRGGLCVYEGSVEHMSLFLNESGIVISSKIQTPIERLMQIASKPTELTIKVANRVLSTRDDILVYGKKYGSLLEFGIKTPVSDINPNNIWDLFIRTIIHKYRYCWQFVLIQYFALMAAILMLMMTFDYGIGLPDSCYNKTDDNILAHLVIIHDNLQQSTDINSTSPTVNSIDTSTLNQHIAVLPGMNLIEQNIKFIFIITINLTLFHLFASIIDWNEDIIVACNEHRNGFININSFIFVKGIVDMITPFLNCLTLCLIIYFFHLKHPMSTLDEWRFGYFFLSQFANVACAQSLGRVVSVLSIRNRKLSNFLILISTIVLIFFGGYLIPLNNEDTEWLWYISNVSFLKQSFELALISLYGLFRCSNKSENNAGHISMLFGYGTNETSKSNDAVSIVLEHYSIDSIEHFLLDLFLISFHYLLYCFLFWLLMLNQVYPSIFITTDEMKRKKLLNKSIKKSKNELMNSSSNMDLEFGLPNKFNGKKF